MKKFVVLSLLFLLTACLYAQDTNDKKISKAEWEQYQQYKQEQTDKVQLSDEEYAEYQKYLEEKNKQERTTIEKETAVEKEEKTDKADSIKENKVNENEFIVKFGKILTSTTKVKASNSYYGTSGTTETTSSDGWKLRGEFFHYLASNTAIGCGIDYETNFKSNETNICDIDVLLKQRFPMQFRDKTYLYLSGGLGYGFSTGETKGYIDENYYIELGGGLHFILSFGIDFTPFIIDLSYSYNDVDVKTNVPYGSMEIKYYNFVLSVGYKFSL